MAEQSLTPTVYYKSKRKVGSKITFAREPTQTVYNGTITDLYWATDTAGTNPITSVGFNSPVYLIVKTKDIRTPTISVMLATENATTEDMISGELNTIVDVPLTVNSSGIGIGYYKIETEDEDEMAFRNAVWKDMTSQRTYSTVYQNTTGNTIMVSIWAKNNARKLQVSTDSTNWVSVSTLGHDDDDGEGCAIAIPPNHYYRVNGSTTIGQWAELRKD